MPKTKMVSREELILSSISSSPKSIKEISLVTKIPVASVYRVIKKLDTGGFVVKCGTIDEFGVRVNRYKSRTIISK